MSQGAEIRTFMRAATAEQAGLVTRGLSLRILSGVVLMTPVDTGRARGNWQVHLEEGTREPVERLDQGGETVIAQGSQTIAAQRGTQRIVLDNNVPYIGRLEEGYSRQAPQGMVATTLASLGLNTGIDE